MNDFKHTIIPILQHYGVKKASVFGSTARGDFDEHSDLDILIDPPKDMGLSFITLKNELEEKLHKKVDLVTYEGISKYLKDDILKHQIPLL